MAEMDVDPPAGIVSKKDDDKKRFEVKKVCSFVACLLNSSLNKLVECRCVVGMGYAST